MLQWQDVDSQTWQNLLGALPHDFYQLFDYLHLDAKADHGKALTLAAQFDGRDALLPLVLRPIPTEISGEKRLVDARSPYGYPGIVYSLDTPLEYLEGLLRSIHVMARSRGIVSTFLRLHPILNVALCNYERTPGIEIVRRGRTVSTDLSVTPEKLDAQMRSNHRRNVKRLLVAGFAVRFDHWGDYADFQRLYRDTMERKDAGGRYFFDDEYFTELARLLGDRLRLCSVVTEDGEIVAAGLFVRSGDLVEYHLGATSGDYLRLAPSKLMFYAAIRRFQAEGAARLHLGGGLGAAEDSLYQFKRGFGTDTHEFSVAHFIHDRDTYERLVDRRVRCESAADFFPAYRAS